jgi:hypothetical protein
MDERLNQTITVTETGDRLAAVLERLSKLAGVELTAVPPLRDTTLTCRYEGTLSRFMDALVHLFAVDKDNPASWSDEGSDRYTLARSPEVERAAQRLRRERQDVLTRAMDQAIRNGHRDTKGLETLTDQQRAYLYEGGAITAHSDELGGKEFLAARLGPNAAAWAHDTAATVWMTGRNPQMRVLCWRLWEARQQVEEGIGVWQLCSDFELGVLQQDWRDRYGDPAPRTSEVVIVSASAPKAVPEYIEYREPQWTTRRAILLRIAKKAKVNLIADDAGQAMNEDMQPVRGTVAELLDAACEFSTGPPDASAGCHASFWRKVGDVYLIRSLSWPEEETS